MKRRAHALDTVSTVAELNSSFLNSAGNMRPAQKSSVATSVASCVSTSALCGGGGTHMKSNVSSSTGSALVDSICVLPSCAIVLRTMSRAIDMSMRSAVANGSTRPSRVGAGAASAGTLMTGAVVFVVVVNDDDDDEEDDDDDDEVDATTTAEANAWNTEVEADDDDEPEAAAADAVATGAASLSPPIPLTSIAARALRSAHMSTLAAAASAAKSAYDAAMLVYGHATSTLTYSSRRGSSSSPASTLAAARCRSSS